MESIKWGILGAGNIAHRFVASLAHEPHSEVVAISGRNQARLDAFAEETGISDATIYLDHQELIDDDTIDAIYIALPHGLHEQWVCAALYAGKAVLCEKPLALSEAEVAHMAYVARESATLLMEGMKARFVPLHTALAQTIRDNDLGSVQSVETIQRVPIYPERGGYIVDPAQGGLLWDVGVYGISWIEELLKGEPVLEKLSMRREAGVDWFEDAHLSFGNKSAHLIVEGSSAYQSTCTITFERGSVVVDTLQRPQAAQLMVGGSSTTIEAPYKVDDFYGEISHFVELLRSGATESDVMSLDASLRMAHISDTIRAGFDQA